MTELVSFRPQVTLVLPVRRLHQRHAVAEAQAVSLEADHLARIVGDRPNRLESEIQEDLRTDTVVAEIRLEAEPLVRLDGVRAFVLQLVRLELVEQADASPFLVEIDHDAAPLRLDHLHRRVELPAAVAAEGVEDVAREALRVHPHQHALTIGQVAVDQRHMLVVVDVVAIPDDLPRTMLRRQSRLSDAMHQTFVLQPVRHELRDRDERQAMVFRELLQLRSTRGGAVVIQDLTDHAGWVESRQARQVDRRLRMPDALEHTALARAQGEDMATVTEVAGHRGRVYRDADRGRAILSADTGADAEARRRIDAHRVCRAIIVDVGLAHGCEPELVDALARQRDANEAARLPNHEVDHLGRHELRRANEVALILPVLVVGNDDEAAGANVVYGLFYGVGSHTKSLRGLRGLRV